MHGQAMNPATEAGNRLSNTPSQCDDQRINLYVVSVSKFLLLYGFTAGGYMVYWSYRNWASYKAETGAPIAPLLRAALWPFFILPLFEVVQNGLDRTGRCYFWQPETRGLLIMLLVMFSVLVSTPNVLVVPATSKARARCRFARCASMATAWWQAQPPSWTAMPPNCSRAPVS